MSNALSLPANVTSPADYEHQLLAAFQAAPWDTDTARRVLDRGHALVDAFGTFDPASVSERTRERARELGTIGLRAGDLRQYLALVRASMDARPNPSAAMTMVGILLAGYRLPSNAPNLETHMQTVAFDLVDSGYSPAIVARACQCWRRANKFPPTGSAELLQACAEAQAELKGALNLGTRLERILERAEAIAAAPAPE